MRSCNGSICDDWRPKDLQDPARSSLSVLMSKLLITISSDEMEAFAEARNGVQITREEVMEALKAKGVVFGIDETAMAALTNSARAESRVCIALGTRPQGGRPAKVELRFDQDTLVRTGEILCLLDGAAEAPCPGRTVRDKELPAAEAPPPPQLELENVEFREEDGTWRSLVPGYVAKQGPRIRVEPLVRISDDRMTASVRMYPPKTGASPLTAERLGRLLQEAGVVHGFSEKVLQNFIKFMESSDPTKWFIVARGSEPTHGRDAMIEFLSGAETRVGSELQDGRIDYRQQRETPAVKVGDPLVRKHPATAGSPGRTVTGEAVPARPGQDRDVEAGENVQASADGLTYVAGIEGIAVRDGNRIRVVDLLEVDGDVDFSTGDLDLEKSGLLVRGTIRSTFSVKAAGTIVVEDSIEDAIVESTENIEVGKGILNGKLGSVTAGACVRAVFTQNARVLAGDSIQIRDSAFHSILAAKKSISIREGKGVLVGGHAVAGQRVEVKVAGSKANPKTVLQVGLDYEAVRKIDKDLQAVEQALAKMMAAGGENLARFAGEGASAPKDPRVRELLGRWREQEGKKQTLLRTRATLLEKCEAEMGEDAMIVIEETAYRGVEIIIGDASHQITDTGPGGRFVYDRQSREIKRFDV